jgi:dTDP-4-amino-4,6-dideoxygalactose transaminase
MLNKNGKLAILGGEPAFPTPVHVGRPNLGDRTRLLERFEKILDNKWFTNNGPFLLEFEQRLAEYIGVKNCIAVCNATVGLEIAIRAADLSGEVIVPSFTFVATAHALQWQGITPVFCDIDPATHNLDPVCVEQLVTPRTTGIIGVHLWGRPCTPEALAEIANRHRLKLLFDAAHAFGCSHNQKLIGNLGGAEVFSFHATKCFNTFEGGAITTSDDELAGRIRLMRNFGFAGYDEVVHVGTNGKMNEFCAAMGITSLESFAKVIETNRNNYDVYDNLLKDIPGIRLLRYDVAQRNNFQYVVLDVDSGKAHLSRDLLQKALWAENVLARRYFYPGCHRMEPYKTQDPAAGEHLKATEFVCERVLTLPTGTAVSIEDIKTICGIVRTAVRDADLLRQHPAVPVRAAGGSMQ